MMAHDGNAAESSINAARVLRHIILRHGSTSFVALKQSLAKVYQNRGEFMSHREIEEIFFFAKEVLLISEEAFLRAFLDVFGEAIKTWYPPNDTTSLRTLQVERDRQSTGPTVSDS